MYIDLIFLIVLIVLVIYFFRSFSSFIYLICSIDILYRLLHFLSDNLGLPELSVLINKYIPSSVIDSLSNYVGTSGILYTIVIWAIFIIYSIFLFYIVRILIRRK